MAQVSLSRREAFPSDGGIVRPLLRNLLPATASLVVLYFAEVVPPAPLVVAWLLAFVLALSLALLRQRRIQEAGAYLEALLEGRDPGPFLEDTLLDDGGLYRALPRLRRAFEERRERAESTLAHRLIEAVLDGVDDPLFLVDAKRRIAHVNAPARALFAGAKAGAPLVNALRDPALGAAVEAALAGTSSQVTLQLAGPPVRAFAVAIRPLDAGPVGRGVLVALRERTEQVQIERMRSDFVANASHEIRTPLAAIRGFVETLQGPARDDPAARERFLAIMAGQTERMGRLVDDLLSLSRIELAEHQPPRERIAPGPILVRVVDSLEPLATRREAALPLDLPESLPKIVGDADQVAEVFTNVIENALMYGAGAPVRVEARVEASAPPGAGPLTGRPALAVSVIDKGEGIPAELIPRLTERFFRVDKARARREGGTGLGLAIVKHILRRHQGHLAVSSVLGEGSRFTIYLPLATD